MVLVRLTNHKCYALLGKTDIHPMGTHRNPYVLHYIYTEPSERGQGYATNRSKKLKEVYEITLFADELDSLFVNAGFHSFSDGFIFRYPK